MTFKQFILSRLQLFCVLVTLFLAASALMGIFLVPDQEIRPYHLFSPIIIAALCVLPTCVTFFKKEPTPLQYMLRLAAELTLVEAIVLLLVTPPASQDPFLFRVILGAAVVVIYILVTLLMWLQRYWQSKKMTEQLLRLQRSCE